MRITQLLKEKEQDKKNSKPITIAFIGDSVTQGCFECYMKSPTALETVYDYKSAYSTRVREFLNILYPSAQVNIINSGISGDNTDGGVARFERDVLSYNPDLCVISFGLNDSASGIEAVEKYIANLEKMFSMLKERKIEAIFLTENTMCTHTSPHLEEEKFVVLSKVFAKIQNDGVLGEYFSRARELCHRYGVKVCDLYPVFEAMEGAGVNTTELLANKLNHPIRELHYYIAMKLVETMILE